MEIKEVEISTLNEAAYNPRKLSIKQYQDLKASLTEFGLVDPIVVNSHPDRHNVIIGGHQRVKVWRDLGNDTIAVVYISLTLERERQLNIRLNKNQGEFDQEILLAEFTKDELIEWGFEEVDFDTASIELADETQGDDDVPDPIEEPVTVIGDLYELGPHRLLCGDATNLQNVETLMGEEKADLIVTDPPYNVDYEGKTKQKLKIKNDSMGDSTFYQFLSDTFTHYFAFTKDGGALYVFHADSEGLNFRRAFVESGFDLKQCCIWIKDVMVMGRQDYHWQHEPILYGWKPGASHFWNSDRKQTTFWSFDRPKQSKEHPTMKPIDLVCYPIMNSSQKGQIVMDLFGGSGSTLIASEKTGRICRAMELDPRYCDVIVKRYITFCKKNDRPVEIKKNGKCCTEFE